MPQVQAYEKVYGHKGEAVVGTLSRNVQASQLARSPEVKAEIQRLADQLCPIGDLRLVRERMLSNMQWLATESPDHRVRLAATKMLHDIADERLKRERELRTVNVDRLIDDIRELAPAAPKQELELTAADEAETVDAGGAEAIDQANSGPAASS